MDAYSILVTGANRGIGLEFVHQLVHLPKPPCFIFATYRSENSIQTLKDIQLSSKRSQLILIKADVRKQDDLEKARDVIAEKVGEHGLTLLINNAGVRYPRNFPNITNKNLHLQFHVNTVGPILVFQTMLPLLQKAAARKLSQKMTVSRAAVLNIAAMVGSITRTGVENLQDLGMPGYKISKAALNMSMRIIAVDVKEDGILVVMMSPGWVKTEMGTQMATLTTGESVHDILEILPKLDESHHGSFVDRFGSPYPF